MYQCTCTRVYIHLFSAGGTQILTNVYMVGDGGAETFDDIHFFETLENTCLCSAGSAETFENVHLIGA